MPELWPKTPKNRAKLDNRQLYSAALSPTRSTRVSEQHPMKFPLIITLYFEAKQPIDAVLSEQRAKFRDVPTSGAVRRSISSSNVVSFISPIKSSQFTRKIGGAAQRGPPAGLAAAICDRNRPIFRFRKPPRP